MQTSQMFINRRLDKGIAVHPHSETPLRNKKEQTTDAHNSRGDSQGRWLKEVRPQNTQSMTPIRQSQHGWHGADPDHPGLGRAPDCRGRRKLSGVVEMLYILTMVMAIQAHTLVKRHPPVHFTRVRFILGKPHLAKVPFKTSPAARYKLCWPNPEPESSRVRRKWMQRCSRRRALQLLNSISQPDIETLGF